MFADDPKARGNLCYKTRISVQCPGILNVYTVFMYDIVKRSVYK